MLVHHTVKKVAVVVGSTRVIRVGPSVSDLVFNHLSQELSTQYPTTPAPVSLHILDLADHPLPFFDEPGIPSQISSPAEYVHEHTRAWSAVISGFDAFVFVTPQYNWNIPAVLKNAIDFLFSEWKGKPALVISYGGHGGEKAAEALVQILTGLRMEVDTETVNFSLTPRERMTSAAKKGVLIAGTEEYWADDLTKTRGLFAKLLKKL